MIGRAGGKPVCVYRHRSKCKGPIESHHPVELKDNGDKTYTVPACKHHHNEETQRARAERAKRRGGKGRERTMSKTKSNSTGKKSSGGGGGMDNETLMTVIVLGGAAILGLGYLWKRVQASGQSLSDLIPDTSGVTTAATNLLPVLHNAAVTAVVTAVVILIGRALHRRRAASIARLAEAIARAANTVPDELRVRCGGLTISSGSARYSATFDDRPGTRTRAGVEEVIAHKVGHHLTFRWEPARDTVYWSRDHGDHTDATTACPPRSSTPPRPGPTPTSCACRRR